jgi:hypothetical protein
MTPWCLLPRSLFLTHTHPPQRYCKDNPSRFSNADGAYMLAFAIIMLNTGENAAARRMLAASCMRQGWAQEDSTLTRLCTQLPHALTTPAHLTPQTRTTRSPSAGWPRQTLLP